MDGVSSAHAETIIQHWLTHTVDVLGRRYESLPNDMNRRLIGDQQRSGEIVCFCLDPAVASTLTVLRERRRALVAKKAMRQLVADIAALAINVMRL